MLISLFTIVVGLLLVYFVWGSVDPNTVQDLESRLSRGSAITQESGGSARVRNLMGVAVTATMFLAGLYYDLVRQAPRGAAPASEAAYDGPADTKAVDPRFTDQIDAAVLEKEVERRRAVYADREP